MRQEGCPTLDAEKEQREAKSDTTIQSIFGASEDDVRKLAEINELPGKMETDSKPVQREEIKLGCPFFELFHKKSCQRFLNSLKFKDSSKKSRTID